MVKGLDSKSNGFARAGSNPADVVSFSFCQHHSRFFPSFDKHGKVWLIQISTNLLNLYYKLKENYFGNFKIKQICNNKGRNQVPNLPPQPRFNRKIVLSFSKLNQHKQLMVIHKLGVSQLPMIDQTRTRCKTVWSRWSQAPLKLRTSNKIGARLPKWEQMSSRFKSNNQSKLKFWIKVRVPAICLNY